MLAVSYVAQWCAKKILKTVLIVGGSAGVVGLGAVAVKKHMESKTDDGESILSNTVVKTTPTPQPKIEVVVEDLPPPPEAQTDKPIKKIPMEILDASQEGEGGN